MIDANVLESIRTALPIGYCATPLSRGPPWGSRDPSVTSNPVAMLLPNVFNKSQCLKKYQLFISDIPEL